MTLPIEEYYALAYSLGFLLELTDPQKTPKVPKEVRKKALDCLKHYPRLDRLDEIYEPYKKFPARY